LLRSEEDGLHHAWDHSRSMTRQAACGAVHLNRVDFREDELLGGEALTLPLRLLDQPLRAARWAGVMQRPSAHTGDQTADQPYEHTTDWSL
jgi:hypothetical protein